MYAILSQLSQPYTIVVVLLLLAIACLWRYRDNATRCVVVLTGLLLLLSVASLPVIGQLSMRTLEGLYPPEEPEPKRADTLVVLGGSLVLENDDGTQVRLGPDSLARSLHALRLYRQAGRCRVIVSGGKVDPSVPGPTLAAAMADFLAESGVRREDLVLEEQSTSTYENALHSRDLIKQNEGKKAEKPAAEGTIYLVTDALHMHRAEGCFRAVGLEVQPAPCSYRTGRQQLSVQSFVPSLEGADAVNDAAHEWLGILWYWSQGRI